MTKAIALIPARGGSKGILNKNLRVIDGRTLLERAIKSAHSATCLDEIWVSSDDKQILDEAKSHGALVHPRSEFASSEFATAADVVGEFLAFHPTAIDASLVYLQPTSPFRTPESVKEAVELHNQTGKPIIGVKDCTELPEKMLQINKDGSLRPFMDENLSNANRQQLGTYFYPTGSLYVFRSKSFLDSGGFPVHDSIPLPLGRIESIDIDTFEDLEIARAISKGRK